MCQLSHTHYTVQLHVHVYTNECTYMYTHTHTHTLSCPVEPLPKKGHMFPQRGDQISHLT